MVVTLRRYVAGQEFPDVSTDPTASISRVKNSTKDLKFVDPHYVVMSYISFQLRLALALLVAVLHQHNMV